MSAALRLFRADRAQMICEMRAYNAAGDHSAADLTHRMLEARHTRRRIGAGGSLTLLDVIVLAVGDVLRPPDRPTT